MMEIYFSSKVDMKKYKVGDLVLNKLFVTSKEIISCSLGLKCEGSYTIIQVIGYKLVEDDVEPLKHIWNGMYFRKLSMKCRVKKLIEYLLHNSAKLIDYFVYLSKLTMKNRKVLTNFKKRYKANIFAN